MCIVPKTIRSIEIYMLAVLSSVFSLQTMRVVKSKRTHLKVVVSMHMCCFEALSNWEEMEGKKVRPAIALPTFSVLNYKI